MEDEVVEELFVRGCALAVHHAGGEGKTPAGASAGRAARQQALAQEVQQLRKALQKHWALQRRLAASAQGRGAGRALQRQLRKLTYEVSKLKDLLVEREESMWEQDRQLREREESSPWRDLRQSASLEGGTGHLAGLRGTPLCPGPGVSQGRRSLEELARVRKDEG